MLDFLWSLCTVSSCKMIDMYDMFIIVKKIPLSIQELINIIFVFSMAWNFQINLVMNFNDIIIKIAIMRQYFDKSDYLKTIIC